FLADDVFVEDLLDLLRLGQFAATRRSLLLHLLANDVVAQFDALVAYEDGRSGDQLAHFMLAFTAEGAVKELAVVSLAVSIVTHNLPSLSSDADRPSGCDA